MKGKAGQREVDSLCLCLDVKPSEGTIEEQLEDIKQCLRMQREIWMRPDCAGDKDMFNIEEELKKLPAQLEFISCMMLRMKSSMWVRQSA